MATVGEVSRHVPSGSVIFRQGDPGEEMFFITSGRVSLRFGSDGRDRELAVVEPGEFFGELALLRNAPRTATAVAVTDTTVLAVRRETFALMMSDDLEVVYRMLAALGRRLGETDSHVAELAQRVRSTRLVGHVLGLCFGCREGTVAVDASEAARDADVGPDDAATLIRTLAARGIGRLDGTRWHLDPAADPPRLAATLAEI